MKKILLLVIALVILVGCTNNTAVTKACSLSQNGMVATIEASAKSENEVVEHLVLTCDVDFEALGITSDLLADEFKAQLSQALEETLLNSIGVSGEGIEVTKNEFTDTSMQLVIEMDIETMVKSNGLESSDLYMDKFVSYMTDVGYACN